jgi:alpha-ribazole phosphatase
MQLWLVRHPLVQLAPGICYGASDVPADPAHTADCATRLAQVLPQGIAGACSPLGRCRSLADALKAHRPDLAFTTDPRLAEMDFGHWEGQHWDGIGRAAVSAWTQDFARHRPGDGESVSDFIARVQAALQATAALDAPQVLWVTHAGVAKAARWLLSGQGPLARADQWPTESLACGDWCVLDLPALNA